MNHDYQSVVTSASAKKKTPLVILPRGYFSPLPNQSIKDATVPFSKLKYKLHIKTVQVNFVVNTEVIEYCVNYEIYLNSP